MHSSASCSIQSHLISSACLFLFVLSQTSRPFCLAVALCHQMKNVLYFSQECSMYISRMNESSDDTLHVVFDGFHDSVL